MSSIRRQLRMLLADRTGPEARALFEVVLRYVVRRVESTAGRTLCSSQTEEIVSDVMLQLVGGGLASFRGDSMGELLAFVRTMTDRTMWRRLRKHRRERAWLDEEGIATSVDWAATVARPDQLVEIVPDHLLSSEDASYLRSLLEAGSKVELARRNGVSRAAVTQRVRRIQDRVAKMGDEYEAALDAWLRREARGMLHVN